MYISDELTVPSASRPIERSQDHQRRLPSGLGAGSARRRQGRRFHSGAHTEWHRRDGYPLSTWSVNPVAKDRLGRRDQAGRGARSATEIDSRENYQDVRGARIEIEGKASELSKENQKLQTELAEIRRVSATAITQFEENKQLKTSNASLTTQVTQLTEEVRDLKRNVMLRWLLSGGALVLIGLALGAWIKSRPKRRSSVMGELEP